MKVKLVQLQEQPAGQLALFQPDCRHSEPTLQMHSFHTKFERPLLPVSTLMQMHVVRAYLRACVQL